MMCLLKDDLPASVSAYYTAVKKKNIMLTKLKPVYLKNPLINGLFRCIKSRYKNTTCYVIGRMRTQYLVFYVDLL